MTTYESDSTPTKSAPSRVLPLWLMGLLPLLAIGVMLLAFAYGNPLALFTAELPPIEGLNVQNVRVIDDGFELSLVNGGPDPVTVAQVTVDDAYWQYAISPLRRPFLAWGAPRSPSIIRVFWESDRSGNLDIWYKRYSHTSGWGADTPLTTGASSDEGVQAAVDTDGDIWVFWHSFSGGNFNIWQRKLIPQI